MATPIKKKSEVQIVSPELEKKLEKNLNDNAKKQPEIKGEEKVEIVVEEPQQEVVIEKPKEVTPPPTKMVKILMKEDHKCYIGGEWYYLLKGKHYNVPENVKNILMGADKLSPL